MACAARTLWTVTNWTHSVSTESLLPYQLGYRSLREYAIHHCFVPQLRAQLFTYHHMQPSLQSLVLSQEAPGKSAASLRISYGIVQYREEPPPTPAELGQLCCKLGQGASGRGWSQKGYQWQGQPNQLLEGVAAGTRNKLFPISPIKFPISPITHSNLND